MRKLTYGFNVSLDGFVEGSDGDLSWGNPSDDLFRHHIEQERLVETHLYGRRLYELMNAYWPTADQDPKASEDVREYARLWKARRTIVFSRTLKEVKGNAELFVGDLAEGIRALKARPGKDINLGGPTLAASVMPLGLIDEYRVYIRPIILGAGKPMFPVLKERIGLELVETTHFDEGVVMLKYVPRARGGGD